MRIDAHHWRMQVTVDASGKKGSLFDALEDIDAVPCIEKVKKLAAMQ